MKNYKQEGDVQKFTAPSPAGVVSGGVYQIGQALVVALATVAATLPFEGLVEGVVEVTKIGSQAWAEGALVYWDNGNARFTTVAGTHRLAGWATKVIGSGSSETTGEIYLDGAARHNETT